MNSSSAWFTRQRPRSCSVTAGMRAVPATAFGEAGSWNRSNQPDSADGEGAARPRSRRQRLFKDRRSARDSNSFSIARRIAPKPSSRSSRSMSSTQSPPERFKKIAARTIWMSSQPWLPAARTWRRIAAPSPLALIKSKYTGRPAKEVRPWRDESDSYWKSSSPCANIPHPVGDGPRIAIQDYLPDSSGPTGNLSFFDAESRERRLRDSPLRLLRGGGRAWGGSASATARRVWRTAPKGPTPASRRENGEGRTPSPTAKSL